MTMYAWMFAGATLLSFMMMSNMNATGAKIADRLSTQRPDALCARVASVTRATVSGVIPPAKLTPTMARRGAAVYAVARPGGIELFDLKLTRSLASMPWSSLRGASATVARSGSMNVDCLTLHRMDGTDVELFVYGIDSTFPELFFDSRPDSNPWPDPTLHVGGPDSV